MIVTLEARSFRNLESLELEPGPRFNVLHGGNGAGKTSVLEAVDYLSTLSSFRKGRAGDLVTHGRERALLGAETTQGKLSRRLRVSLPREGARELAVDGKRPRSLRRWLGVLPTVLFHPGDLAIVAGGPEERRAYLDRILDQLDLTYADARQRYLRALRSRNRLLRTERVDRRSVRAFDELLASTGAVLGRAREELVRSLRVAAIAAFEEMIDEPLGLAVRYVPSTEARVDTLREALSASLEKDLARGYTSKGPHADELSLSLRGTSAARHQASQGQQRVLTLALKVAELEVLAEKLGDEPVLLLDDVSSELDRERNRSLFGVIRRRGGQVFLTTTHPEFILLDEERKDHEIRDGRVCARGRRPAQTAAASARVVSS